MEKIILLGFRFGKTYAIYVFSLSYSCIPSVLFPPPISPTHNVYTQRIISLFLPKIIWGFLYFALTSPSGCLKDFKGPGCKPRLFCSRKMLVPSPHRRAKRLCMFMLFSAAFVPVFLSLIFLKREKQTEPPM